MTGAPSPNPPASGFLWPRHQGQFYIHDTPLRDINREVSGAHRLSDDDFDHLSEQCGIRTIGNLIEADAKAIRSLLPDDGDQRQVMGFVLAAKAHLSPEGEGRVHLHNRALAFGDCLLGSSVDSAAVRPTGWYVSTSQRLAIYRSLPLSPEALALMEQAAALRPDTADRFDNRDLVRLEKALGPAALEAMREVWSWMAVGDISEIEDNASPEWNLDVELAVAIDNLEDHLGRLVESAQISALQTKVDRGLLEGMPSRIPGIISVHDLGLAHAQRSSASAELQRRFLDELLPAVIRLQIGEIPPGAARADSFVREVAAAVEHCLETASETPAGTPPIPPESLKLWEEVINGRPPPHRSVDRRHVNREFIPPDPLVDGPSFRLAVESQRAFAEVERGLSRKVDRLRDAAGHLPGGLAAFFSSERYPVYGEQLFVGEGDTPQGERLSPDAQKWIEDHGVKVERCAGEGNATGSLTDRVSISYDADVFVEFAVRPDVGALRPGLYRGVRRAGIDHNPVGLDFGFKRPAFPTLQAEVLMLRAEEDADGAVSAFTAMFRMAKYDVIGWVVYERPEAAAATNEAES